MKQLENIAQHAHDTALKLGVKEVAINVAQARYTDMSFRERKLEKLEATTTSRLTMRLYLDGRYSANSTSDLRPEAVEDFCKQLVAMTRMLAADEHRRLPDPKWYADRDNRDLQLIDPNRDSVNIDARKAYARAVEDAALAASDKVISVTANIYDDINDSVQLHSNGFLGSRRSGAYWVSSSTSVRGEGDKKPSDSASAGARRFEQLPDAKTLGQESTQRALDSVGADKAASAKMPLLIENRAAGRLLNHFLAPLSAAALQQQRSCFADKLGQSIASSVLTLVDDPFIIQGFGSRHFDGEGLSAKLLPIIDKGVLRSYFVDTYYGRKLAMDPTTASPSNLCFADGKGDLESLCQGIDRGVLVTGFIGGNSSSTTGDFSLGVRGFLIEKGKRGRAITEMNITDNLQTFLPKLVAVGADAYPYSSLRTPSLRFDDVQFSGS